MSYPRYPAYKASGVEWLGEVPGHWGIEALKHSFTVVGGSTPKSEVVEYWDGDITWVTPEDLSNRDDSYVFSSKRAITQDGYDSCGTSLVPADSIVLATRAPIGNVAIAATALCTNQGCKSLVRATDVDSRFYYYFLHIAEPVLQSLGRGSTFLELSGGDLGAFIVPVPPLDEQRAIAAFLDRETAHIDALIAKLEQLIALLQEKRQALISHAVTKGLDPTVPMKDSGVEWLGEVPAHWATVVLGKAAKLQRGHDLPEAQRQEGGVPIVSSSGISSFHNESKALGPGVVTGRYGTIGIIHYVKQDYWPLNTSLYVIEFFGNLPRFVYYLLQILPFDMYSDKSAVPGVNRNHLHTLLVAVPPINEQVAIVEMLDKDKERTEAALAEIEVMREKATERRAALITAAVTGLIDVRNSQ